MALFDNLKTVLTPYAEKINDHTTEIEELSEAVDSLNESLGAFMNTVPVDTASGAVATFADGADNVPVKSLTVNIEPIQSGTGDPSPDNIRPISGWTGTTLTCNNKTINIDWTDEAGEVYGGTLNVTTGVLTKTHVFSELPLTGWSASGVNFWRNQSGMSLSNPAKIGYCSHYICNTSTSGNKVIIFGNSGFSAVSRFVIRDDSFATISDLEAYLSAQKEAGTPVTVAFPLANPQTYRLTPNEIRTLVGENSIASNAGEVHVEYFMDITKYITDIATNVAQSLLVDIDSELSSTSENPVQNKVITEEVEVTNAQISALITQLQ